MEVRDTTYYNALVNARNPADVNFLQNNFDVFPLHLASTVSLYGRLLTGSKEWCHASNLFVELIVES